MGVRVLPAPPVCFRGFSSENACFSAPRTHRNFQRAEAALKIAVARKNNQPCKTPSQAHSSESPSSKGARRSGWPVLGKCCMRVQRGAFSIKSSARLQRGMFSMDSARNVQRDFSAKFSMDSARNVQRDFSAERFFQDSNRLVCYQPVLAGELRHVEVQAPGKQKKQEGVWEASLREQRRTADSVIRRW